MYVEHLAQELAAHLVLTRPLVCVDLEATGIWPGHDRIVQIATASIFPDGSVSTWSSLVNPERSIPPAVTAIHGIADAAVASAPTFAQLAPTVAARLSDCDLTGYNVARFDRRLLAAEFGRVGVADPTTGARVIDAYALFVRQEPRSLDDALRFYGVQPGQVTRQAHDARSDVEATVAVLVAQLHTYPDLPRTVDGLHDWLHPSDPNWIDADGKLIWRDGVASVGPDACPCSAASARYVATCAPMAGRSATMGLDAIRGPQAGGVRRPPSPLRPAAASWCQGGAPCVLTRWCVARGGGARRCADRSYRSGGTGAASPVRGAPDRRPTGPRHRAVPARE